MIQTYIVSDKMNGLTTRWVEALGRDPLTGEVRQISFQIRNGESIPAEAANRFSQGTPMDPVEGTRIWYAYQQRAADELLDQAIFGVFVKLLQRRPLTELSDAGKNIIASSPFHQTLLTELKIAIDAASDAEVRDFISVALVVAVSKIGQQ